MHKTLAIAFVLLLAQARPNFVGHWELINPDDRPVGTAISIDIKSNPQTPNLWSVTRYFDGGDAETRDYQFGESGRYGGISVRGGIPLPLAIQTVTWDNASLLIDQERDTEPERHERWSINAAGELVIESAAKPLALAAEHTTLRYRRR